MDVYESIILEWLAQHYWPFVRISSMLLTMAVFSGRGIPSRIKIFFAIAISMVVAPAIPPHSSNL